MSAAVLDWLLEEDAPGVRLRALLDLCGRPLDDPEVSATRRSVLGTLDAACDLSWTHEPGIQRIYRLTALAECGLTRDDLAVGAAVDAVLEQPFDANCGDYMTLRALVMLGYGADERVTQRLSLAAAAQLPDGGWTCLHRLDRMGRTPKSCMKAALHGLLLAAELHRRGLALPGAASLLRYFLGRRLFYRTTDPEQLVLQARPGWRTIDAFFPNELMRVGLPTLLAALAALGVSRAPEARQAWDLLAAKEDDCGRVRLEGTLAKSYLPRERVGRPGKWVTLYARLAYQARERDDERTGPHRGRGQGPREETPCATRTT